MQLEKSDVGSRSSGILMSMKYKEESSLYRMFLIKYGRESCPISELRWTHKVNMSHCCDEAAKKRQRQFQPASVVRSCDFHVGSWDPQSEAWWKPPGDAVQVDTSPGLEDFLLQVRDWTRWPCGFPKFILLLPPARLETEAEKPLFLPTNSIHGVYDLLVPATTLF